MLLAHRRSCCLGASPGSLGRCLQGCTQQKTPTPWNRSRWPQAPGGMSSCVEAGVGVLGRCTCVRHPHFLLLNYLVCRLLVPGLGSRLPVVPSCNGACPPALCWALPLPLMLYLCSMEAFPLRNFCMSAHLLCCCLAGPGSPHAHTVPTCLSGLREYLRRTKSLLLATKLTLLDFTNSDGCIAEGASLSMEAACRWPIDTPASVAASRSSGSSDACPRSTGRGQAVREEHPKGSIAKARTVCPRRYQKRGVRPERRSFL